MLNLVVLCGRLGKDPELRYTTNGTAVASFSLATDAIINGEKKPEWHNVVCWKTQAENAGKFLKKGSLVLITGRIQTRSYDDKKTGGKRYITEVVSEHIKFLDKKTESNQTEESAAAETRKPSRPDEDLPF